jgi:hypothetical protein
MRWSIKIGSNKSGMKKGESLSLRTKGKIAIINETVETIIGSALISLQL